MQWTCHVVIKVWEAPKRPSTSIYCPPNSKVRVSHTYILFLYTLSNLYTARKYVYCPKKFYVYITVYIIKLCIHIHNCIYRFLSEFLYTYNISVYIVCLCIQYTYMYAVYMAVYRGVRLCIPPIVVVHLAVFPTQPSRCLWYACASVCDDWLRTPWAWSCKHFPCSL